MARLRPTLSYGVRSGVLTRRFLTKLLALILIASVIGIIAWFVSGLAQRWLLEWRVSHYDPPHEFIVYEDGIEMVPSTIKEHYRARADRVFYIPSPWLELAPSIGAWSDGTAFLHELESPSGDRQIVAIDLRRSDKPGPSGEFKLITLVVSQLDPRGQLQHAESISMAVTAGVLMIPAGAKAKIFAGTRHTSAADRFAFQYDVNGAKGSIEGRLFDDGTVRLTQSTSDPIVKFMSLPLTENYGQSPISDP